jgi:serine/threonine-protein kinase
VIGKTIGNYEIQRLVAEGGMGKVYLAAHPEIGRQAAVKVLTGGDVSDPELVSRFVTQARAVNAIRHRPRTSTASTNSIAASRPRQP